VHFSFSEISEAFSGHRGGIPVRWHFHEFQTRTAKQRREIIRLSSLFQHFSMQMANEERGRHAFLEAVSSGISQEAICSLMPVLWPLHRERPVRIDTVQDLAR